MRKFLFYLIFVITSGVICGLVVKIISLPENFWSYFFAFGFIWLILWQVFDFFYQRLFPGEKMFRSQKKG